MNARWFICMLPLLLAGCVMHPKKLEPSPSEHRPEAEDLAYLGQDAELSKPRVIDELGEPMTKSADNSVYLYLYVWRVSSTETHLINPMTLPLIVMAAAYGMPVDPGAALSAMPVHQSFVQHKEKKVMLLIEFDDRNRVARWEMYEYPERVMPMIIAEEWKQDPLPEYFIPMDPSPEIIATIAQSG